MPFQRPNNDAKLACSSGSGDELVIRVRGANSVIPEPGSKFEDICTSIADLEAMLAWCKEQVR